MPKTTFAATDLPVTAPLHLGLPVWQDSSWASHWFGEPAARQQTLQYYARYFNSVEGNTTFYALPSQSTLNKWQAAVPAEFRFTFKLHQDITHNGILGANQVRLEEQLNLMRQLNNQLGLLLIQMPAHFGPAGLAQLDALLAHLADEFPVAVEVRHPEFFTKGEAEVALNRLLMRYGANRIIMDTRALFAGPAQNAMVAEARIKKPRVPVNVIATAQSPVVRFVGGDDHHINQQMLIPWVHKCQQWRQEGKSPFLFLHRPDNKDAPWLAQQFVELHNQCYPKTPLTGPMSATGQQEDLF